MNFFHLHADVLTKSKGQSATVTASYCTASKMKNDITGTISDYSRKRDVIYTGTLLPEHAPAEFADREKLWNSVERIEKNSNAQLARRFSLAIPNEYSREDAIDLFQRIGTYFTDQGMCFDGGIHWKEGNHHFDFLTTMRPFKPDGSWGVKEKKEYALDESGERIPIIDPETGQQKTDKQNRKLWKRVLVDSTGWNTKEAIENWRKSCCEIINQKNKELGLDSQLDHRSYERQGKDIVPHIHEGYRVRNTRHHNGHSSIRAWNRMVDKVNAARRETAEALHEFLDLIREKVERLADRITRIEQDFEQNSGAGVQDPGSGRIGRSKQFITSTESDIAETEQAIEVAERDLSASSDFIEEVTRRTERSKRIRKLLEDGKRERLNGLRRTVSKKLEQIAGRYWQDGPGGVSDCEIDKSTQENTGIGRSTEGFSSESYTDRLITECRITADVARAGLRDSDAVIADSEAYRQEREAQQVRRSPGRKR